MINKTTIFIVLAVLCLNFKVLAQVPVAEIKPLRVGNTLPETFWNQTFYVYENGKFAQQTLAAYKDKLLILEFWATWCSSCTGKYKYLNNLQQSYGGQLKVILVNSVSTRDTKEKIAKNAGRLGKNYCTIVLDTTLYKQFSHTTVPHFIWINNGRWLAATGGDFVQQANIDAVLGKKQPLKASVQTH
ncbi:thiol-disulfide oxidoreductase [compost metagenome]